MSNPTKIYNDYVRANLPSTMTFDTTTDRYDINNHSFFSFKEASWYFKYVTKYGYISLSAYAVNNFDPDLVFDFKQNYYRTGGTETTLSPAVTHTRASSATMTNSSGTLVTVGNNVARVGHHIYNGNAWVNEGVLHESEARTNIILQSNNHTGYVKENVAASVPSGITSPDGTENVIQILNSNTSATRRMYAVTSTGDSTLAWCLSAYVKHKDDLSLGLGLNGNGVPTSAANATFSISASGVSLTSTGQGSTTATAEAGVEDVGNGWYRIYVKTSQLHTTSSAQPNPFFNLTSGGVGDGLYMYGIQIEQGTTPSSYIPTSGSTVTRAAETLTVSAANLPYSSTNMSIQIDGKITYADTNSNFQMMWWEWKLSSSDNMKIHLSTSGASTGLPTFTQKRSATDSPSGVPNNVYSQGINVPFNIASRHGSTFINGAAQGTSYTVNTTPTALPNLSATDLTLGTIFMGTIGKFRMWNEDLTDTGIEEAST